MSLWMREKQGQGERGETELGERRRVAQLPPDLRGNMTPKQGMGAAFWLRQA